jgi:hypothetical protein
VVKIKMTASATGKEMLIRPVEVPSVSITEFERIMCDELFSKPTLADEIIYVQPVGPASATRWSLIADKSLTFIEETMRKRVRAEVDEIITNRECDLPPPPRRDPESWESEICRCGVWVWIRSEDVHVLAPDKRNSGLLKAFRGMLPSVLGDLIAFTTAEFKQAITKDIIAVCDVGGFPLLSRRLRLPPTTSESLIWIWYCGIPFTLENLVTLHVLHIHVPFKTLSLKDRRWV